jgi:hypothetical protein
VVLTQIHMYGNGVYQACSQTLNQRRLYSRFDASQNEDMRNLSKTLLGLVSALLLAGLFYIANPFLYCWYNYHRFNRYVHVQIDLSSCGTASSAPGSEPCRYLYSFEGAEEPGAIQFDGAGLRHSYDQTSRTYMVNGVGRVAYRRNVIELASSNVLVNDQSLPRATQPVLVFVRKDGQLLSGYCDVSW